MTLTEQWKKRTLPNGVYYIKLIGGDILPAFCNTEYILKQFQTMKGIYDGEDIEVLAPVPSYEEWLQLNEVVNRTKASGNYPSKVSQYKARITALTEENQQLKTQIAKLTEIVGVLPSNHSVGNLGYKIKNQRHEITNRLKEINKLKELLKECKEFFEEENPKDFTVMSERMDELLTKIDNAIGADNDKK